jgi:hypothetical protein
MGVQEYAAAGFRPFENLADGITIDGLTALYDGLTREQVQAVLDFAARTLETPGLPESMRVVFDQDA